MADHGSRNVYEDVDNKNEHGDVEAMRPEIGGNFYLDENILKGPQENPRTLEA